MTNPCTAPVCNPRVVIYIPVSKERASINNRNLSSTILADEIEQEAGERKVFQARLAFLSRGVASSWINDLNRPLDYLIRELRLTYKFVLPNYDSQYPRIVSIDITGRNN